ncbi:hypothetical protein CEV32_2525 [Brucella rhizosphaerae]|uniref:Uncharacterized protein n=1 Tax=Brucella rhizosphaerae TaxID=571254 RepID=A0A256F5H6_9HYPH|nr:hypothetical protein CEV32_2525 [Brucella rhizosphaerae]
MDRISDMISCALLLFQRQALVWVKWSDWLDIFKHHYIS